MTARGSALHELAAVINGAMFEDRYAKYTSGSIDQAMVLKQAEAVLQFFETRAVWFANKGLAKHPSDIWKLKGFIRGDTTTAASRGGEVDGQR